ncbi:hypothetical protein GT037_004014 [Alternaria burnsii]|uniref:Uncharacterized protein n=1 Tax=Alternaria burnsii TaxID=1187904 RepID=A0A8H7BC97_9PLEO|nr:uncharacterized protein GT037_004014 [Alternaria burnsii]KAF7678633.1 hypothetical protein GT037_004014 [Alternaria burnsii]
MSNLCNMFSSSQTSKASYIAHAQSRESQTTPTHLDQPTKTSRIAKLVVELTTNPAPRILDSKLAMS